MPFVPGTFKKKFNVDMWTDLFKKQENLNDRLINDSRFPSRNLGRIPNQYRINALMNFFISEVREVKGALGFLHNDQVKWWKNQIEWEHVFEETIDIFHVLLATWLLMNKNPLQVYNKYIEKWQINHDRQDNGY